MTQLVFFLEEPSAREMLKGAPPEAASQYLRNGLSGI